MAKKTSDLTTELPRLRRLARMSQKDLATSTAAIGPASKVSVATIQAIESGLTNPKAPTLLKLADGLARDPFTNEVNEVRAVALYQDLARAAGYAPARLQGEQEPPEPPEDTLKRHIVEAFGDNAHDIEAFLRDATRYDDADKDFILKTVIWLKSLMTAGRAVRERHALFSS